MICYQDKTFCPFYSECESGESCDRALNKKIIDCAKKWWGSDGAPIMQFAEKPECFVGKERN